MIARPRRLTRGRPAAHAAAMTTRTHRALARTAGPAWLALFVLFAPLVLLAATARPAAAQSSRWKEIGKTTTGNPVYVDPKTVKKQPDGIVAAMLRIRYLTPVKMRDGELRSARSSAMVDCAKRLTATKESAMYFDEAGTKLAQRTVNKVPGFSSPIKGTPGDLALQHLCAAR